MAAEIRAELARRRMQQAELAVLVKEDPSWVSRILGERRRITVDDLERIASALGLGAVDLLPLDARGGSRVTAGYRDQADSIVADRPDGRPRAGDVSPVRLDHTRRPRRPGRTHPPMPIMHRAAA